MNSSETWWNVADAAIDFDTGKMKIREINDIFWIMIQLRRYAGDLKLI